MTMRACYWMSSSLLVAAACVACAKQEESAAPAPLPPLVLDCSFGGGAGAPSTCLSPRQTPDYYVAQAQKYFDTLDNKADPNSQPVYSDLVARWEWPPWLKLTGYTRQTINDADKLVKVATPSTVPTRDCKAFPVQPFARCHVSFQYKEGGCPIYEEFTFNDQGEMTFIEAWSEGPKSPGYGSDRWAEAPGVRRLSTRVPGLGNKTGRIDLDATWMQEAARRDEELADFVVRARDFWGTWFAELREAGPGIFKAGCGW